MLIADGQRRLEEIGRQEKETLSKKEIIKKYADIHELNYDIMNIFVDRIEVGRRNGCQEEYPVISIMIPASSQLMENDSNTG